MRILLLARSLGRGGAERQLSQLACFLKAHGEEVMVAVFYVGGVFDKHLNAASVPLVNLEKKRTWDVFGTCWRLLRLVREFQPDVLYSFMLSPNIFAAGIKPLIGNSKLVWGIRTAAPDWRIYGRGAAIAARVEPILAKFVDLIICNSQAGQRASVQRGFPEGKIIVIPNGIDTELFRPDTVARQGMREMWGVQEQEILVGHVGRLDPHKGHPLFFDAMRKVMLKVPAVRAVCVGEGPEPYASKLKRLADTEIGGDRIIWAGAEDNMVAVYNALDVLALCSSVEGFPNVLAEAMSCGTPVVTTSAGDAASIVADDACVVPLGEPDSLAQAIIQCINGSRAQIGARNRNRICKAYSMAYVTNHFLQSVT